MNVPYTRFLRSGNLATWKQCLASADTQMSNSSPDVRRLAQGTSIATYVMWLGERSGDSSSREDASRIRDRFVQRIGSAFVDDTSPDGIYATAVVLASTGFGRSAEELLTPLVEVPADLALMVMPSDEARRTARLRDMALGQSSFPPTFYFYCDALLRLGRIGEVARLVRERQLDPTDPYVADLLGTIHERGGQWREALAVYEHSSWPTHRVRAALCATIVGASEMSARVQTDLEQRGARQTLAQFTNEIDQLELARLSAFVNSCRWNAVDGWLVDFELGKLSYRRRRYWEADAYVRRAEASAPKHALFAIRNLQFFNLTWLTSSRDDDALPMLPEALEAGFGALEAADASDTDAEIRLWIAPNADDHTLLLPLLDHEDPYVRAQAHRTRGDSIEELTALLASMAFTYTPRALGRLIERFADVRFYRAADYLTALVLKESADDFFVVWELGSVLLRVADRLEPRSAAHQRMAERIKTVSVLLQQLSQSDFQHLIRAFEFFADQQRDDLAEFVLNRAAGLAEGAEENLAVANARVSRLRFNIGEGAQQGLECLVRAERQASCLIDRLRVARAYFAYGQIERGRAILARDAVFDEGRRMNDIEFVIALRCGTWLEPPEFQALARNAVASAARNLRAGTRRRVELLFLLRLVDTIAHVDKAFAKHLMLENGFRRVESPAEPPDSAPARANEANAAGTAPDAVLHRLAEGISPGGTLGPLDEIMSSRPAAALAVWARLLRGLVLEESSERPTERPARTDAETPICKTPKLHNARTAALDGLWHVLATATGDNERQLARAQIHAFHEDERRRLAAWQEHRRQLSEPSLRRQVESCRKGATILHAIIDRRLFVRDASPLLRALSHEIGRDAAECLAELHRREARVRARLHAGDNVSPSSPSPADAHVE